jgi:hypothetical protein
MSSVTIKLLRGCCSRERHFTECSCRIVCFCWLTVCLSDHVATGWPPVESDCDERERRSAALLAKHFAYTTAGCLAGTDKASACRPNFWPYPVTYTKSSATVEGLLAPDGRERRTAISFDDDKPTRRTIWFFYCRQRNNQRRDNCI